MTTWTNPQTAPKKIREWAGRQLVRVVKVNEVFERWQRWDGQTMVVRW